MIISLEEAQKIYKNVTQEDLDGLEMAIRELTNNPFQNRRLRFSNLRFETEQTFVVFEEVRGLRRGDTIQISQSVLNQGIYTIDLIEGNRITVAGNPRFFEGADNKAYLTKIDYPSDIIAGVKKLLTYDAKMTDKIGLKSETVSRMSKTYYDQNRTETVNGYPAAMMSFINKYRLLRW